jgi:hypothetical protein
VASRPRQHFWQHQWVEPDTPELSPAALFAIAVCPARVLLGVKRCACGATRKVWA